MNTRAPLIAICGTSQATAEEAAMAREAGRLVAEAGGVVVCGGLTGVMAAAAEGARAVGGVSIGFLPGKDAADASEAVTYAIPTGLGEMRNGLVANASAAMIAIGGGYGTLSEIALMLRMGRPVAGVRTWPVYQPGSTELDGTVHWTDSVSDAVGWALEKAKA